MGLGGTYITVSSEVLKELYLAQCSLGQNLLAEHVGNLLDSDALVGLVVHSGTIAVESRTVSPNPIQRSKNAQQRNAGLGRLTRQYHKRPDPAL